MIYILMALIAGGLIIFTRIMNSNLGQKIGIFNGTFFNYFVGLIFAGAYLFVELINGNGTGSSFAFQSIPWWAWLGGFTGVLVMGLTNFITPKISSFAQTLLVFIGQLTAGVLIDYFTSGKISFGKIIGGALVLAGLVYNSKIDQEKGNKEEPLCES